MLFHSLLDERSVDVYVIQMTISIEGNLHVDTLKEAARSLLSRHAGLRAAYLHRRTGQAVQVIAKDVELPWAQLDVRNRPATEQMSALARRSEQDRLRKFDVTAPPLIRFTLVRLGEFTHALIVTVHHLLLDGWSMPIVIGDLIELYARGGTEAGMLPARGTVGYLQWLREQDTGAAETAWRRRLDGLEEPTLVAPGETDRVPTPPRRVSLEFSEAFTSALTSSARTLDVTLNTLIQGAWAMVVGRMTGQRDVVFGSTVSGRPPEVEGIADMVGMMVNTVPVRVTSHHSEPAAEMLRRIQREWADMMPHQHLGLADIQRLGGLGKLFDTATAFENIPARGGVLPAHSAGLRFSLLENSDSAGAMHYPVSLIAVPGTRLTLHLNYRTEALDAAVAAHWIDALRRCLDAFSTDPELPLGRIDILDEAERQRVLEEWNDTEVDLPSAVL
ncbi:condensation domain-containing protein, partial [Streptomyces sp. 900116325]